MDDDQRENYHALATTAHYASLAIAFAALLYLVRDQWFSTDEWSFVVDRPLSDGIRVLFEPHNEHWSTAPVLLYRALFSVFGLRTHIPYLVPLLLLHLAVAHLLWRLIQQTGTSIWIATGLVAAFLVGGGGAESLLLSVQSGFVGAIALGLLAILLTNHADRDRRDVLAVALLVLSLTFSGIAVTMVATAGMVAVLRRGWKAAVLIVAPPAAAYLVWFLAIGRDGLGELHARDLPHVPRFVWAGLVATVNDSTVSVGGAVILVALAAYLLLHARGARGSAAPVFAMALGAVLLYLMVAPGRVARFDARGTIPSRYVYVGWTLLLPAFAWALHKLTRRGPMRIAIVLLVSGVLLVNGSRLLIDRVESEEDREAFLRREILASAVVVSTEPFLPDAVIDAQSAEALTAGALADLQRDGELPPLPDLSPAERVGAAALVQVRFSDAGSTPLSSTRVPRVLSITGGTAQLDDEGCVVVRPATGRPELELSVDARSALVVRGAREGRIDVQLRDSGASASASHRSGSRAPVLIELATAGKGTVLVLPGASPSTVCHVSLESPA